MAANNWAVGRTGKVFVKAESTYGTAPTFVATDAVRHKAVNLPFNPRNRVWSPARYADPSYRTRLTRRATGSFDLSPLMLIPSGTLGTAPEADALLLAGLGTKSAPTPLSTTISASPAPSTTGATVAAATGLAVGQFIQIGIASGPSAGLYGRLLTGISTLALTWAPALPVAPASGDTVKSGVTYSLATALPNSLDIAHYNTNKNREQLGCVADKLIFTFDANSEPGLQVSGPAAGFAASAQAQPGSFTTVGSENGTPSGLTGGLVLNGAALDILKAVFTINNGYDLQNAEYGTSVARAMYRKTRRIIDLGIDTMVSDQLTLDAAALATSDQSVLLQTGSTSGKIICVYAPVAEFEVPDMPDGDETNTQSYKGLAKGNLGNDEFYLGFL